MLPFWLGDEGVDGLLELVGENEHKQSVHVQVSVILTRGAVRMSSSNKKKDAAKR